MGFRGSPVRVRPSRLTKPRSDKHVKAGKAFKDLGPLKHACNTVKGLIDRHDVDPTAIEALAYGVVVPERGRRHQADYHHERRDQW